MDKYKEGSEVFEVIQQQASEIVKAGGKPEVIVMGSYVHYLLKGYWLKNIAPKDTNPYHDLIFLDVDGIILEILIHRETLKEGKTKIETFNIKVY